ncbi:MAG: asparagine synthase (glutamine-hydrolyzing) [Myxococcales bacterium]|nr:asparagine synthase (glutamine-hydrolyzing) [Myxococcales bacterium]
MCGIVGVISSGEPPRQFVDEALRVLAHRGPEGSSSARHGNAYLGHSKLGFVDIADSRQPYVSRSGATITVFNGEIYERHELRARLRAAGHPADAPGEVALIGEAYDAWGLDAVAALDGMFAIVIYDKARDETFLFRDRFGKKPLYYFLADGGVVFASELAALRRHPGCPTTVDPEALALYFTFNAVPGPRSLLAGVRKVPAGSAIRVRAGRDEQVAEWVPRLAPQRSASYGSVELDRFEHALMRAVRRRLDAEAPVGVLLSGGLDSGLVGVLAAKTTSAPLRSFSLGFAEDPTFDETAQAERMARCAGTLHTSVVVTRRMLADAAPDVLLTIDEPIADQSLIPTAMICREAQKHVKAVLTGDGADDLLMGYRIFLAAEILRRARALVPERMIMGALACIGELPPGDSNLHHAHVAKLLARAFTAPPEHQFYVAAAAFLPSEWAQILHPDLAPWASGVQPFAQIDALVAASPSATPAERMELGMVCHFLRDVILTKLDRASMRASVEARSPFLDRNLVEHMLALPAVAKLRWLRTKSIVKEIASRHMPDELVHQRKRGFRLPTAPLLRGELREYMLDTLSSARLRHDGLLRTSAVERLMREHLSGRWDHHRQLWSLLCFQSWRIGGAI